MYKIIIINNFGDESISDKLYLDSFNNEEQAKTLAKDKNLTNKDESEYYIVVPQEQELYDAFKDLP